MQVISYDWGRRKPKKQKKQKDSLDSPTIPILFLLSSFTRWWALIIDPKTTAAAAATTRQHPAAHEKTDEEISLQSQKASTEEAYLWWQKEKTTPPSPAMQCPTDVAQEQKRLCSLLWRAFLYRTLVWIVLFFSLVVSPLRNRKMICFPSSFVDALLSDMLL